MIHIKKNNPPKKFQEFKHNYEPRNPQNELDYSNLLAVCTGNNAGDSLKRQHCDTKKGDKYLHIDPQNIDHINHIFYRSDGTIYARNNDDFNDDSNSTLNLNDDYGYLKFNRKRALVELKRKILDCCQDKTADRAFIEKTLQFYRNKDQNGEYRSYCGILIDYLLKHLKRRAQ